MWLKLSWRDHRLSWDPLLYNNINIIRSVNFLLDINQVSLSHLQSVAQLPVEA